MQTITTDLQNAFNDPERYGFVLMTFTLGDSVRGLWTGQGEKDYNGLTYRAGGSVIDCDDIQDAGDGSISDITLSLSEDPDKGLTSDIILTFLDEDWHMQSLVIETGLLNPDTGDIIGSTVLFDGVMAQAPWTQQVGQANKLSLRAISRAYTMSEAGGKSRNDQTQRLIDPDDTSLVDIGVYGATLTKDLHWGQ